MQSFQERFKVKSSIIGKTGELEINPDRFVNKPTQIQLHSPVIKTSARSIVEHSSYESYSSKVPCSASPKHKAPSPKRQQSQAPPSSFTSPLDESLPIRNDYKPYTIHDYYSIKPQKYYELGGLGAATIGTEEWLKRKNVSEKRKAYGIGTVKNAREGVFSDNSKQEIIEKIKCHSVTHNRHYSALT